MLEEKKRQPLQPLPDAEEFRTLEQAAAEQQQQAAARQRELSVIDLHYGSPELSYNRDRVEGEILQIGQQIAWSFYEIGKRLILLKEHEPYGEFTAALERLGIAIRTARRWMQAAAVVDKSKTVNLAVLPAQKLIELGTLADDELEALGEGETVAGLVLDELDKMSYSELKTQVRGHKAEQKALQEAADKAFSRKDKEINQRDKEILRLQAELNAPSEATVQARIESEKDKALLAIKKGGDAVRDAYRALELALLDLCKIEGMGFDCLSQTQDELALRVEEMDKARKHLLNGIDNLRPWQEGDGQHMFDEVF